MLRSIVTIAAALALCPLASFGAESGQSQVQEDAGKKAKKKKQQPGRAEVKDHRAFPDVKVETDPDTGRVVKVDGKPTDTQEAEGKKPSATMRANPGPKPKAE